MKYFCWSRLWRLPRVDPLRLYRLRQTWFNVSRSKAGGRRRFRQSTNIRPFSHGEENKQDPSRTLAPAFCHQKQEKCRGVPSFEPSGGRAGQLPALVSSSDLNLTRWGREKEAGTFRHHDLEKTPNAYARATVLGSTLEYVQGGIAGWQAGVPCRFVGY